MNRLHDYGHGQSRNQLAQLEEWGVFTGPLPAQPEKFSSLVDLTDESAPLEDRARAYLHSNCSHCHRLWGGGVTDFQVQADLALDKTGTVDVRPERGSYGLDDARLIAPGHPERSLIPYRMTLLGLGRMPHIGSNVVDDKAVALLQKWIGEMK